MSKRDENITNNKNNEPQKGSRPLKDIVLEQGINVLEQGINVLKRGINIVEQLFEGGNLNAPNTSEIYGDQRPRFWKNNSAEEQRLRMKKLVEEYKNIENLINEKHATVDEFQLRAEQRKKRRQEFERASTIQNAYQGLGGIHSLLERLQEYYEKSEITGKPASPGVLFTVLKEIYYGIEKLDRKLEEQEQNQNNQTAKLEPMEEEILNLWQGVQEVYQQLSQPGKNDSYEVQNGKLSNYERLTDDLYEKMNHLEELLKDLPQDWFLPPFDPEPMEKLLLKFRQLKTEAKLDQLGNDFKDPQSTSFIQQTADIVEKIADQEILPNWGN